MKRFIIIFSLFLSVILLSAESFPTPDREGKETLVGITVVSQENLSSSSLLYTGQEDFQISVDDTEWDVIWLRIPAGKYNLENPNLYNINDNSALQLEIPDASVWLAPFVIQNSSGGISLERINESLRQRAGQRLASYVDYSEWAVYPMIGFGSLRPERNPEATRYLINISSNQENTEIYIDDILVGISPQTLLLDGGKHRVMLRKEGFLDDIHYIRMRGEAEITGELIPLVRKEQPRNQEQYKTLMAPFLNLGEEEDIHQLSTLLGEILLPVMSEDIRLETQTGEINWNHRGAIKHPDFMLLEERSLDLVVTGFFKQVGTELTVQANLYDVQSESVKAGVTWHGITGLALFQALDEIKIDFAREVDKVLPEAGRTLITRQETVFQGRSVSEGSVARKELIKNRREEFPHILEAGLGISSVFEKYDIEAVSGDISYDITRMNDAALFMNSLHWEFDYSPRFSTHSSLWIEYSSIEMEEGIDGEVSYTPSIELGINTGIVLVLRSVRTELGFGILGQIHYSPEYTYGFYETVQNYEKAGPFIYTSAPMLLSFKYYLNKRSDKNPLFVYGNGYVNFINYRMDLGNRGMDGFVSLKVSFASGLGVRL